MRWPVSALHGTAGGQGLCFPQVSLEVGDGEGIIGVIVSVGGHFFCYRPRTNTEWQSVDSVGGHVAEGVRGLGASVMVRQVSVTK